MSNDQSKVIASRQLVIFLNKYSEVLELQLLGVRDTLSNAVQNVMEGVITMSKRTGEEAKEADKVLEKTYFEPDRETKEFISTIQESVDHLLEKLQSHTISREEIEIAQTENPIDNRLRRFMGQFSKHMEALSTMDGAIGNQLFKMMAALSSDDVIGQRLEHILHSVHALEVGLSYVLLDLKGGLNREDVEKLRHDLLSFTYKSFTMEEEKQVFKDIFGEPPADYKQSRFSIKK